MAKVVTESYVDDIEGGPANETVEFALDRVTYEIDLTNDNAKKLREALKEYIEYARRADTSRRRTPRPTGRGRRPVGRSSVDREQNTAIREWARKRGYEVSDRGRIPSHVLEAYHREH